MSEMQHKTLEVEFKDLADDGSFTMYAACFGNVDRGGDVIDAGAFDNLAEFTKDGWIALSHDQMALPIAIVGTATQDATGLLISGKFHSTPAAQACRTVFKERMAAGKGVKASIGYRTTEESYDKVNGQMVRRIKKLSVFEASFVNLPMNPAAGATQVKGLNPHPEPTEETMEQDDEKGSALDTLKRLLGLSTKRSVAISAANHKMLSAYADTIDEHHKAMGAAHKAACGAMKELKAFVGGFKPGAGDDEPDADDEPAEKPKKKPEKSAEAETHEPATPPLSSNDQALTAYRDMLKRRDLACRARQNCP